MKAQKAAAPVWTQEEKQAAEQCFAQELGILVKHIALGRHKGHRRLSEAIFGISLKIQAAHTLGVTEAKGLPRELYWEPFGTLVAELVPLVEFRSSPQMRDSIFTRIRKVLADAGVEERYLSQVATPSQKVDRARDTTGL